MKDQGQLELATGSWDDFGAGNPRTIGEAIGAIRQTALTESDKGTRFETLVRQVLPTLPEYEMRKVWRFGDWPERETRMGRDRLDLGIDLVAELNSGEFVAIQCKFWAEHRKLSYKDLSTFFADAAPIKERNREFVCLMVIATCPLTGAALQQLRGRNGRHISFCHKYRDDRLDYKGIKRPHKPLQRPLDAVSGLLARRYSRHSALRPIEPRPPVGYWREAGSRRAGDRAGSVYRGRCCVQSAPRGIGCESLRAVRYELLRATQRDRPDRESHTRVLRCGS